MSGKLRTRRVGQWLEISVASRMADGLAETAGGGKPGEGIEDAANYVRETLNLPDKLIRKLRHAGGLIWDKDRLRVRLFPDEQDDFEPEWFPLDVLYEDDYCLVVNKPAGMRVHPTAPGERGTLAHAVASYYECSGQRCRVRHIHRLDEHTSGPVLYAKNELAHLRLDEAMRVKAIERIYVAFASGKVTPRSGIIREPIGKDRHHPNRRRVSPTGDAAVTRFEVIEQYVSASLVRLRLETGRTHQIRVHMSHRGHPLLGDALYGGSTKLMDRQALHGEELYFPHPFSGETIRVRAPWPQDMLDLQQRLQI